MRTSILCVAFLCIVDCSAQNALQFCDLLGEHPNEVDLTEYMGLDIDTVHSASWRYVSRTKGVLVQAHIDRYDRENAVISTITVYFSKAGYERFMGVLPYGLEPSNTWKKNKSVLVKKAGFTSVVVEKVVDLGLELKFQAFNDDKTIYVTAVYLEDEKGDIQKGMYSLQFSLLSEER